MKFKMILITCTVMLAMIAVVTRPVQGADIAVDNPTNTIASDAACSLAEAIENANNDAQTHADCAAGSGADTLTFTLTQTVAVTGSAFATSSTLSGTQAYYPDIISEITLVEPSLYDLDFTNLGNVRVFNVMTTGNLTLEGVGILNSTVNPVPNYPGTPANHARGGAIYLDDGTLSMIWSKLADNSATGSNSASGGYTPQPAYGGAIYGTANSTIASLTSVSFLSNFAQGGNDSITVNSGGEAAGGAIYTLGSMGTIDDLTLSDNIATGGSGGDFDGNALGGGIYAQTVTSLVNSTISGNSVTGGSDGSGGQAFGGGLYVPGSIGLLDNVTVSNNSATGGSGSGLSGFNGKGYGGGIYAQSITHLINSRFTGNSVLGGDDNTGDYGDTGAVGHGGGLYVSTAADISNVQFESNTATGGNGRIGGNGQGGAIYVQSSVTTLRNSTFLSNTVTGGNGRGTSPDWRGGNGDGGAIYANSGTFNNLTFYNNTAVGGTGGGGASSGNGGAVSVANTTINHNTFLGNTAANNGDNITSRGNVTLTASIVTSVGGVSDCSGSISDGGNNLRQDGGENSCVASGSLTVGTHIAAAPADNGCATTAAGSCISTITALDAPVIDGTGGACPAVNNADGRGFGRSQFCDVGAYESASELYADIEITKSVALTVDGADAGLYNPGDTITYTIVVTNNGPVDTPDVTVADTLPSGVTFSGWTAAFTGLATGNASGSGNINEAVNIPVNGTVTYTVTGVINADANGTVSNTATASDDTLTDSDTGNNSATANFDVTNLTDIAVTNSVTLTTDSADSGLYNPGDGVTYTIVVTNNGPVDAPEVLVSDTFPSAVAVTGWTAAYAGSASGNAGGSGNLSETASIPVSGTVTYTVTGVITSDASGTISNTVTVATVLPVDIDSGNNSATADFDVTNGGAVFKAEASILGINQVVDEGNTTVQATVQLDVPAEFSDSGDITVTVSDAGVADATSGADYTAFSPVTLTFSGPLTPGSTPQQSVSVSILEDIQVEGTETLALTITAVTGEAVSGQPGTHTIVISDDDIADSGAFNLFVQFNLQQLQFYLDREIVNNPDIVEIEQALATRFFAANDAIIFTVRTTAGTVGNLEVNITDTGQGFVTFSLGDVSITDADFNAVIQREMLMLVVESIDRLLYDESSLNLDAMTVNDESIQAQISR